MKGSQQIMPPAQERKLNILFLAPHPFYQNRGTPIAVDLLVETLSRLGHSIDLLTFNEGVERTYNNTRILRVGRLLKLTGIKPGFSLKKVLLDIAMMFRVATLLVQNRYDVIHAVEESAFIAWFFNLLTRKPYIYDMDSSLATQMTDKLSVLKPIKFVLDWLESLPIKRALVVVPVCESLLVLAKRYRQNGVHLLKDISMLDTTPLVNLPEDAIKKHIVLASIVPKNSRIILYVGNLEPYQGIDLLLDSMALVIAQQQDLALIVVGGTHSDIASYENKAKRLGLGEQCVFAGPKPLVLLNSLCAQASLLVSPRTMGENTPMKLYSYLGSGIPVLATDLPTHTEVINSDIGSVAIPSPPAFAHEILKIFGDYPKAVLKATAAKEHIQENHSFTSFQNRVKQIYADVGQSLPSVVSQ